MTVNAQQSLVSYDYDSAQASRTVFPIPFYFEKNSDILVYTLLYPLAPPYWPLVRVVLASPGDYAINFGAGLHSGGQITLAAAQTSEGGEFLVIERRIPVTQTTDLTNVGQVYPETVELALDKIVMMLQQMEYILSSTDPTKSRLLALQNGTVSGAPAQYDAQQNTIGNLVNPSWPDEAATKSYVDAIRDAIRLYEGIGSPEGVVTADIGALYVNQSGGVSTTLYVKTSGAGDTGWTAK